MRTIGLLVAVLLLFSLGCASGDSELDRLWDQGYGFNNPNADR